MMKYLIRVCLLLLLIIFTGNAVIVCETNVAREYWPKETWRTSTPEEQGMDSQRIYRMRFPSGFPE